MSPSDGSDVRQTNGSTLQFFGCQLSLFGQVSESFQLELDVSEGERVDLFDVRDD